MKGFPLAAGPQPAPYDFLSGWKDIAKYLGKGVRTVQRYERNVGLLIRRPYKKVPGSVIATKGELEAWVKESPLRRGFKVESRAPGARGGENRDNPHTKELPHDPGKNEP